jgi:ketosteroid isomerase-like protein
MDRETFDDYIRRFNAQDATAFDDYIAPDMHMLNGGLELIGAEGMKEHYAKIWASFSEELHVEDGRFARIQVAYNSFTNTKVDGEQVELGIPH